MLTCKSFVILGYRAVSLFPSGQLKMNSFIRERKSVISIFYADLLFFELISSVTIFLEMVLEFIFSTSVIISDRMACEITVGAVVGETLRVEFDEICHRCWWANSFQASTWQKLCW